MAIRRATTFVLDRNVGIFWRHAFSKQVIFHIIDKQATVRFPICSESDSRLFHLGSLIKCRRTTVDAVFSNEEYRKILHTTYDSFHIISLNPCIIQCQCIRLCVKADSSIVITQHIFCVICINSDASYLQAIAAISF